MILAASEFKARCLDLLDRLRRTRLARLWKA
jgi:hypothetical protein